MKNTIKITTATALALLAFTGLSQAQVEVLPPKPGPAASPAPTIHAEMNWNKDFPGGSASGVESGAGLGFPWTKTEVLIDQANQTIFFNTNKDTPPGSLNLGWGIWWYIELTGVDPAKDVIVDVGRGNYALPTQAVYSIDGGVTWQHTSKLYDLRKGDPYGNRGKYKMTLPPGTHTVRVAWGAPFVSTDATALVNSMAAKPGVGGKAFNLATTIVTDLDPVARETPAFRVGAGANKPLIWVSARQHAFETWSSWTAKGFGEWLVSNDPQAVWLRENYEIVFVPVMDVDLVDRGYGGKFQKPHDHNRDWSDAPIYKSVAAAEAIIKSAVAGPGLAAFVDFHNPGAFSKKSGFFVSGKYGDGPQKGESIASPAALTNRRRFLEIAQDVIDGPMGLRQPKQSLTYINGPGSGETTVKWKEVSIVWVDLLGTPAITLSMEIPYDAPYCTTESCREIGAKTGKALTLALQEQVELGGKGKD